MIYIYIAFCIDLIIGDPYFLPHPIVAIGNLISVTEKYARKVFKNLKIAGLFFTAFVLTVVLFVTFILLFIAKSINIYPIIATYLLFSCFASTCLAREAKKIFVALKQNDINLARKQLSYLVGRETENLNEQQIIKATVETVAENTSDGIIAPLFYAFIGGAPLAIAYKSINTMDSMVGYKNEKYIDFGYFSAKLDDVANLIPARICGFIMPLCGGKNIIQSYKIMLRDRKSHSSPNSAYPESAVAGSLGIQLGGSSVYFGKVVEKPTIGDNLRLPEICDITKTIKIMYATSILCVIIFSVIILSIRLLIGDHL